MQVNSLTTNLASQYTHDYPCKSTRSWLPLPSQYTHDYWLSLQVKTLMTILASQNTHDYPCMSTCSWLPLQVNSLMTIDYPCKSKHSWLSLQVKTLMTILASQLAHDYPCKSIHSWLPLQVNLFTTTLASQHYPCKSTRSRLSLQVKTLMTTLASQHTHDYPCKSTHSWLLASQLTTTLALQLSHDYLCKSNILTLLYASNALMTSLPTLDHSNSQTVRYYRISLQDSCEYQYTGRKYIFASKIRYWCNVRGWVGGTSRAMPINLSGWEQMHKWWNACFWKTYSYNF